MAGRGRREIGRATALRPGLAVGRPRRLSASDAPRRHSRADAVRRVLQVRRLPHRPDPGGGEGADHPWPFRPCARRPRRGARHAGDARLHAAALRREFRRPHAGGPLRRDADARRRARHLPSGRPRARLGADRGRGQWPADRRLRRLQGRARSDLRAVRAGALRRVHHRGDVRPAGVPPRQSGRRDRAAAALGRSCFPSARISSAPIRSARRSA